MKVFSFSKLTKPLLVAEIGNNHEGNFKNAVKLINLAKKAGADVVKFQYIIPEKLYHHTEKKRINFLKKVCLNLEDFKKLSKISKKKKILFSITPFDENSVTHLKNYVDIFKVSSSDNNYYRLIDKILETKKPIVISTGLSSYVEINKLYKHILSKTKNLDKVCLLHCVSNYPTNYEETNLNFINLMKKDFKKISIGYSDHVPGIYASIVACNFGIKVLEKHFTLDKKFSSFRDHQLSADYDDLNFLSKFIHAQQLILGKIKRKDKILSDKKQIKNLRRSAYLNRTINKNEEVLYKDLTFLRPMKSDNLYSFYKFKKSNVKKKLRKGELINLNNLY